MCARARSKCRGGADRIPRQYEPAGTDDGVLLGARGVLARAGRGDVAGRRGLEPWTRPLGALVDDCLRGTDVTRGRMDTRRACISAESSAWTHMWRISRPRTVYTLSSIPPSNLSRAARAITTTTTAGTHILHLGAPELRVRLEVCVRQVRLAERRELEIAERVSRPREIGPAARAAVSRPRCQNPLELIHTPPFDDRAGDVDVAPLHARDGGGGEVAVVVRRIGDLGGGEVLWEKLQ